MKMLLGKLVTQPLQDSGDLEVGQFELDVDVDKAMFLASGDKPGLVKRQFAAHLAHAMLATEVPVEYWRGHIVAKVASACGLPEQLNFGRKIQ